MGRACVQDGNEGSGVKKATPNSAKKMSYADAAAAAAARLHRRGWASSGGASVADSGSPLGSPPSPSREGPPRANAARSIRTPPSARRSTAPLAAASSGSFQHLGPRAAPYPPPEQQQQQPASLSPVTAADAVAAAAAALRSLGPVPSSSVLRGRVGTDPGSPSAAAAEVPTWQDSESKVRARFPTFLECTEFVLLAPRFQM